MVVGHSIPGFSQGDDSDYVIVELNQLQQDPKTGQFLLPEYEKRRLNWGFNAAIILRYFTPLDYQSPIDDSSYSALYDEQSMAIPEVQFGVQRNFGLGSLGLDLSAGNSNISKDARSLSISTLRGSAALYLNTLFSGPYLVPYAKVGMVQYQVKDDFEEVELQAFTDGPAIFFTGGVLVQLNWVEPASATRSYMSYGLENTFIVFEMTQHQAASDDHDLKAGPDFGVGLMLEF